LGLFACATDGVLAILLQLLLSSSLALTASRVDVRPFLYFRYRKLNKQAIISNFKTQKSFFLKKSCPEGGKSLSFSLGVDGDG
jgi:hypothetical protein